MRTSRRATQRTVLKTNDAASIPTDLRRRLGHWLRVTRIEAGLTQRDLADLVGLDGVNHISAIENGRGNIQMERYHLFAAALGMTHAEFGKVVLRHTDPWIYQALTGSREQALLDELKTIAKSVEP